MNWKVDKTSKQLPLGCEFDDLQLKIIHSYLSKKDMYEAYKSVNFNMFWYQDLLKIKNNAKE